MSKDLHNNLHAPVNFVRVIGIVERSPRLHQTSKATVLTFFVRTEEPFKHPSGRNAMSVESHRVVVFGKEAEAYAQSVAIGREVLVEGRLRTRKWTDEKRVSRWITEIIARQVQVTKERAA